MRTPDGGWLAPPPPWPPIGGAKEASNLARFIDLDEAFVGAVTDVGGLRRALC